jgi:hypothetical protein
MNNRNRIPTVFSIYMLDVICCALGCVILLWQLKHQEADEQAEEITSITSEIASLQKERDEVKALLHSERTEGRRLLALRQKEYDDLRAALLASQAILKTLNIDHDKLKEHYRLSTAELASKVKDNAELLLQLTAIETKTQTMQKQVAAQRLDAEEAARRLQAQLARLQTIEALNKEMLAKLSLRDLRIKVLEQDLERGKHDVALTAKDMATARALIKALQDDKLVLVERAKAIQAEADQRFAGITLTGQNVLFLVDMSGSMAMSDEDTADPDKWPLVCGTVAQLMRSIKGLQYFQVIAFSDKVRYPLGNPAAWLKYDPKATPDKALAALKAVSPDGETNMHAAFAEAFRYREAGLDTIYVLSDGLPNSGGDGMPASLARVSEQERTTYLSKHLRSKLKNDWNRPVSGQKRVRINSIGFFFESPDVGAFLWALSREHDGSFVGMSK